MIVKRWRYYVSYAHSLGFGCIEIMQNMPITTFAQVKKMTEWIENDCKAKGMHGGITVLYYQLLDHDFGEMNPDGDNIID